MATFGGLNMSIFDAAVDRFIDQHANDEMLVDVENRQCKLVTPLKSIENAEDPQALLENIKTVLKVETTPRLESQEPVKRRASLSSRASFEGPKNRTDTLEKNRNEMILEHAEAVIEYQRERINILEKTVERYNAALSKTNDMHKEEVQKYEENNKELRVQMQNIIADYEAISKRYEVDMSEFEKLKIKSLNDDSEMIKRNETIKELSTKLNILPKENEFLKEEKERLLREIKHLKLEILPNLPEPSKNPRLDTHYVGESHVICDVRKRETAAMGKCLIQVENDLLSYKRLSEDQRVEIQRLHSIIDNLKARGTSRPEQFILSAQKQILQLRHLFANTVKRQDVVEKEVTREHQNVGEDDLNNRSLHAAYVLKSTSEQRDMYDKLLEIVKNAMSFKSNTSYFYRCTALYSFVDEIESEYESQMRLFEINDGVILIHTLAEDREHVTSTDRLPLSNVQVVNTDFGNLRFILKEDDMYHIITLNTSDLYNRMYHALQYAGFIVEDRRLTIYSSIDLSTLEPEDHWPSDLIAIHFSQAINFSINQSDSLFSCILDTTQSVSVISDMIPTLLSYDQDLNALIAYGPNLANRPRIFPCDQCVLFRIQGYDGDITIPVATFPNGLPIDSFFNIPFTIYCMVMFKSVQWNSNQTHDCSSDASPSISTEHSTLKSVDLKILYLVPRDSRSSIALNALIKRIRFCTEEMLDIDHSSDGEPSVITSISKDEETFYRFRDNFLELYIDSNDKPVLVDTTADYYKINSTTSEVAIITNVNSEKRETYVLAIDDREKYEKFLADLKNSELKLLKGDINNTLGQVCVVSKGYIQLYDQQNSPIAVPIIVFQPTNTAIHVDEKLRKIMIIQKADKVIRMSLDCTNPVEFSRWKFALTFSGFLEHEEPDANINSALKEFIFPIKIFDEQAPEERRAFNVFREKILLYTHPAADDPFLVWEKSDLSIEKYEKERRLRLYTRKGSKFEERFDLLIPLLTDYQNILAVLGQFEYVFEKPIKKITLKYQYVVAKPGTISLHETKYDKTALITLNNSEYKCQVKSAGFIIKFTPTITTKRTMKLVFKKEHSFRRWLLALKVAGFLPLSTENIPVLYFPTIIYGFACTESKSLFKQYRI
ncbi:conserved hypothetical protein [Theileria equi strain WA]|uniref:Uncharacterized protein n=1 Tax=Theileria equi strain WA TaxID=1537102 RepID=L1LDG6_THEEQ|nr:conserved hypothetical protein [Theileria equi strain WA]EKX73275.1 conserved hypothetical protein [Theileria equi strain WA]|eukprot:XP_004832727.1 conserved hypothetical protein [Theileria equi strain WA]